MFSAYFLALLAALGCVAAADLVLESPGSDEGSLVLFGSTIATVTGRSLTLLLCAVSATAALALVTAIARVRGRRLERRMAAELDDRWEELSQRHAGDMARYELLSWRIAELQTSLDQLLDKRDEAYEEMRRARQRTFELREKAERQRETLQELARMAENQLVAVPDLPEELLSTERITG